jgi:crotonobetainyl-CoA:carnitine CoA-transferase CaiB-like acyl-CoA transferase
MFLAALGLSDDPDMQAQFDPQQWPQQTTKLAQIFLQHPRDHWCQMFDDSDACVAPVLSPHEAQSDPHIAARGIWQNGQPAAAPRFDGALPQSPAPSPLRGQDSPDILRELKERGLL